MRVHHLVVLVVALTAAVIAPAPAQAAITRSCGTASAAPELPQVTVLTCVDSEGDLRRSVSIVVNERTTALVLTEFLTLLSYPRYSQATCPGAVAAQSSLSCASPWVPTISSPHSQGVAFTAVRANGPLKIVNHVAPLAP
jgi:hypothetical protein